MHRRHRHGAAGLDGPDALTALPSDVAPAAASRFAALRDPRVLAHDLVAGATVGLVAIPQAMAFALIAGVPPQIALYTMIVPGLVAGLLRDSPHLAPGATNTAALLVGGVLATSPLVASHGTVAILSALCVIVGVTNVFVGAAGLGRLSRYVSPAVVQGFTLGAAVLLVFGQLPNALGVPTPRAHAFLPGVGEIAASLGAIDGRAVALAAVTIATISLLARIAPRAPGALLALGGAAVLAQFAGVTGEDGVQTLGFLPRELPRLALPALAPSVLATLLPSGLAIALVGMSEVVSIGRALALRTGRPLHTDRELRAQGAANLASACFPCLPSSVSWTRSAASVEAGAQTPAAVVFASLTVAASILALAPLSGSVPLAAVAGVVIWIAARMVRPRDLARVRRADRTDFALLAATTALTLLVDLPIAVLGGVALSLGVVISRASLLRVSELQRGPAGHLVERPLDAITGAHPITLLQVEGDLFFGVADELEAVLRTVATRGTRGIVLRLKRTFALDAAAAEALARFALEHRARGGALALCGLRPELERRIAATSLAAALGADAVFETGDRPFASLERALQQVQERLELPRGLEPVRAASEKPSDETWSI